MKKIPPLLVGDFRSVSPRFNQENLAKNYALVELIQDHMHAKGVTPVQLALSWILHTQKIIVPLFGTTKESRLIENIGALQVSWSQKKLEFFQKIGRNQNRRGSLP